VSKEEELRREIDEAIERIDAKLATSATDNVELQAERAEKEQARSKLDEPELT